MTQDNAQPPIDPISPTPAVPDAGLTPAGTGMADALRDGWAALPAGQRTLLLAALAATAVLALGTLLTWYNAAIVHVSGVSTGAGKFTLLLAVASVAAVGAAVARKLPAPTVWPALAGVQAGMVTFLLVLMWRFHHAISGAFDNMPDDNPMASAMAKEFAASVSAGTGVGFGLYVCVLGALAAAAAYAVVAEPELAGLKVPGRPQRIGLALGVGAVLGLVVGAIC